MPEEALGTRPEGVSVCARVVPGQKLAIVRALQQGDPVVAMTGDGVNDVPALRAANVGVAMGKRRTDVGREAAELTLLDDRFASVAALRARRRIFSNTRKSMRYVATIHMPLALLTLLALPVGRCCCTRRTSCSWKSGSTAPAAWPSRTSRRKRA